MKIWKKRISAILAAALLVTAISPNIRVQAGTSANAESGSNAIEAETEYYSETPSNATKIVVETPSNAAELNVVSFTDVGPLLPPVTNMRLFRLARSVSSTSNIPEGIFLNKKAEYDSENDRYTITLESYVEGKISTTSQKYPVDVVLVLDTSGSMDFCLAHGIEGHTIYNYEEVGTAGGLTSGSYYYMNEQDEYNRAYYCNSCRGWYTSQHKNIGPFGNHNAGTKLGNTTILYRRGSISECPKRMPALKDAANAFIDVVAKSAAEEGLDHRVALIRFSSENNSADISNGLQDVMEVSENENIINNENVAALHNAIDALTASGGTYPDEAMEKAGQLFADSTGETRQRVVIMFTDGQPGGTNYNPFNNSVANDTIAASYKLKNTYGATVYTIGIFDGAAPKESFDEDNTIDKSNRFMHYVSSNYRYAENMSTPGAELTTGYYLATKDADELEEIFKKIGDQIQSGASKVELSTETVVKDVVSQYFELPKGTTEDDIDVWTQKCTGYSNGEYTFSSDQETYEDAEIVIENDTVSVSNFDYKKNYVSDTARDEGTGEIDESKDFMGRKLVVQFEIEPKAGFLGGNGVPTNADNGATLESTALENGKVYFEQEPVVNVPIPEITFVPQDKNVYLTVGANEDDLIADVTATANGTQLGWVQQEKEEDGSFILEPTEEGKSWTADFVKITASVALTDDDRDFLEDTEYEVTVMISPLTESAEDNAATEVSKTESANIYVFKPTITYNDDVVYYGDKLSYSNKVDYFNTLKMSIVWKHGDTCSTDNGVTMTGTEPNINYFDYDMAEGKLKIENSEIIINTKEDVTVTVKSIKIGGIDGRDITNYTTLERNKCEDDAETDDRSDFVLHVKTCSLDVQKIGGSSEETYIMNVKRNGDDYTTVTVTGGETVSLKELPVGEYTIEEDTNWSWRYTANFNGKDTVLLNKGNPTDRITCTNTKSEDQWLNVTSVVKNIFGHGKAESNLEYGEDGEQSE